MSSLLSFLNPKDKAKKSGEEEGETSDDRWVKSKTAGSTSRTTLLVNKTNKKLVFRDKIGAAYGATRYKILGNSEIKVTTLRHTFFKMIAYAIEEEEEEEEEREEGEHTSNEAPQQGNQKKKKIKRGVDTKLTIDSDRLVDCKKIVISFDGSMYKVAYVRR